LAGLGRAEAWEHYRGPQYNGTSAERGWAKGWSGQTPRQLWRKEVGIGASSFTVRNGRVFTHGNVKDRDVVYCLDALTGEEIWTHAYPCKFEERMYEGGTAATPTLDGDRVYVLSYDGQFLCLDAATGKPVWRRHLVEDFGGRLSDWKYAGSPTVVGDRVIVDCGGDGSSTLALNKLTGEKLWATGRDKAGYAPAIPFRHGEAEAVLLFKATAMVAKATRDGEEFWRIPWKTPWDVNASAPFVLGDKLFLSSGYPAGRGALYQLTAAQPVKIWQNDDLKTKMCSAAPHEGHVYGVTEKGRKTLCIRLEDGRTVWSADVGGDHGNLVIVDGTLVILSSDGELILAPATPAGFQPLARAKVLPGRCWVQPTLSGGVLFAKNNKGLTVALDLSR
jgi:outer membrane protein assembly factor BamB